MRSAVLDHERSMRAASARSDIHNPTALSSDMPLLERPMDSRRVRPAPPHRCCRIPDPSPPTGTPSCSSVYRCFSHIPTCASGGSRPWALTTRCHTGRCGAPSSWPAPPRGPRADSQKGRVCPYVVHPSPSGSARPAYTTTRRVKRLHVRRCRLQLVQPELCPPFASSPRAPRLPESLRGAARGIRSARL